MPIHGGWERLNKNFRETAFSLPSELNPPLQFNALDNRSAFKLRWYSALLANESFQAALRSMALKLTPSGAN